MLIMYKKNLSIFLSILRINYLMVFIVKRIRFVNNLLLKHGWSDHGYSYFKRIFQYFEKEFNENGIDLKNKSIVEIGSCNLPGLGYFFLTFNKAKFFLATDPYRKNNISTVKNLKKQKIIIDSFRKEKKDLSNIVNIRNNLIIFNKKNLSFGKYNIIDKNLFVDNKFDILVSNAVLEHIHRDKMEIAIKNMMKILKPNGIIAHQIDFRDHICFNRPLNNLKYSEKQWNNISRGTIFYTNRLKLSNYMRLFKKFNLHIISVNKQFFNVAYSKNFKIHSEFNDLTQEDLALKGAFILLKNNF